MVSVQNFFFLGLIKIVLVFVVCFIVFDCVNFRIVDLNLMIFVIVVYKTNFVLLLVMRFIVIGLLVSKLI